MPPVPTPHLDVAALRHGLVENSSTDWQGLDVVVETGSTNSDLVQLANRDLTVDRHLLLAEYQHTGRGRYTRSWESPAAASVIFSALIRTGAVKPTRWALLPLALGIAVIDGLRDTLHSNSRLTVRDYPELSLKWPNDVLCNGSKLAGMLVEMAAVGKTYEDGTSAAAIIPGVGLNVTQTAEELPVDYATSLALELGDKAPQREELAINILVQLDRRVGEWRRGSHRIVADYVARCSTIGQDVEVQLPDGVRVLGKALDIAEDGCLLLRRDDGTIDAIRAGDVRHIRGGGCYLP